MKHLLRSILAVITVLIAQTSWAQLEIGKAPKSLVLQDKLGGRLSGEPWRSEEMVGTVSIVFYVDPDEADLNNDASEALKNENFPEDKVRSYAVVNMAATWLPNFVISNILENKQKQYKSTIYVRDYKKVLIKEWGLSDQTSDVLAFDNAGDLFFRKDGKLTAEEIQNLIKAIHAKMNK